MPRKRHSAEEIVAKLRQADVFAVAGTNGCRRRSRVGGVKYAGCAMSYSTARSSPRYERLRWSMEPERIQETAPRPRTLRLAIEPPAPEGIMPATSQTVAQRPPLN